MLILDGLKDHPYKLQNYVPPFTYPEHAKIQLWFSGCINFDIKITNLGKMNQTDAKNPPLIYSIKQKRQLNHYSQQKM